MDEGDLPRIVVEDDSIIVEDGDWVARDVADGDESSDDDEEKEKEALEDLAVSYGAAEAVLHLTLRSLGSKYPRREGKDLVEEALRGVEDFSEGVSGKTGDVYDAGENFGYDEVGNVEYDVSSGMIEERPEDVWGKRSGLEIAGFRDEEVERKRADARFRR